MGKSHPVNVLLLGFLWNNTPLSPTTPASSSAPVFESKAPASRAPWDSLRFPSGRPSIRARFACAPACPGSSALLPRPVPAPPRTESRKADAVRDRPSSLQLRRRETVHQKCSHRSTLQRFSPFPSQDEAAMPANAAPVPGESPPPLPAFELAAAPPALPSAARAPAAALLRCGARLPPCSRPHGLRAHPNATVARFSSPTLSAECGSEFSEHTAKESLPRVVSLLRLSNPSAARA